MSEKADIFHVKIRVAWKRKRGNGYVNYYRGSEIDPLTAVTRSGTPEEMNANPVFIGQIMQSMGLTSKSVYDFHVVEVLDKTPLGKSFFYDK